MYKRNQTVCSSVNDFEIREGFHLDENNRWVILSKLIDWGELEEEYASLFNEKIGAPAKSFRIALGSLLIQQILKTTDRETIEQIKENPYIQYFLGIKSYEYKTPIDSSMLVHFRKRIKIELIEKINREIVEKGIEAEKIEEEKKKSKRVGKENQGQLMLDATCIPSELKYPTDLGLLNHGREILNRLIDILYKPLKGKLEKKPRTDRKKARKSYLKVAKKKKVTVKERKKAIKQQLKYVRKNLGIIVDLIAQGSSLELLTKKQQKELETIRNLYGQQLWMYENNRQSIESRIVSIEQEYIRPIVRGKARQSVEFGAKISISYLKGYVLLDKISWENFNESKYLVESVEKYYEYTGYYPESIHVDKIYRTRENRKYCREKGIRMSGPKLGRPSKNISIEEKKQAQLDERIRNRVEGKFGEGKRRYGLNLIRTKLQETSENTIAMSILAMNLMTLLRRVIRALFCLFLQLQLKTRMNDKINFDLINIRKRFAY